MKHAWLLLLAFGCEATATPSLGGGDAAMPTTDAGVEEEVATVAQTLTAARFYAPALVERGLSAEEVATLEADPTRLPEIVRAWGEEPALARSARRLVERALAVSGTERDGIDYGVPGRLVEAVVRNGEPWGHILTRDRCVDPSGADVDCDSGAPYAAGVLTTRAFLAVRAGRFNLTRAGTLTHGFLCSNYPMPESMEPRLPRDTLLPMFRALTAAEQTDPEAAMSGLANGFHCYSCHGQFGAHAQLFVRFDTQGRWHEEASGLQNPDGMPGESFDGLMTSHLIEGLASDERSQMLGREVANLGEAAEAVAEHPEFLRCAVEKIVAHAVPTTSVDRRFSTEVAATLGEDPTFVDLVVATLTHPRFVRSLGEQLGAP
ncbi:MAG: hypothetical protein H6722_00200 [Sandaracinus sp.]|nr:hypothetical protein [Sandaracinus sp.]MCB9610866.1 hypothetical protein [Sandaracinus sp.]